MSSTQQDISYICAQPMKNKHQENTHTHTHTKQKTKTKTKKIQKTKQIFQYVVIHSSISQLEEYTESCITIATEM